MILFIRIINELLIKLGLKFRKINSDNPHQVAARIKSLELINLKYYNIKTILTINLNSFPIPVNFWPQLKGHLFYRGQICPKNQPFTTKSRISYNPSPGAKTGRANLPFKSTFYAANAMDTAAIEACQDDLRNTSKREFDLVLGEWELTKDIEAAIICHSEDAQKAGTDVGEAVKAIDPLIREGKTEEQYQAAIKVNIFYAKQFSKKVIKHSNDYLFSALFANTLLSSKSQEQKAVSLWYPSVAYKYMGFNVIFRTQLIDDRELILKKVYHYRLKFENLDSYPKIDIIKEAKEVKGNIINW